MRVLIVILVLTKLAAAHDVRGEVVFVDVGDHVVDLEIDVPLWQLATARHVEVAQLVAAPSLLAGDAQAYVSLRGRDGAAFEMAIRSIATKHLPDGDTMSFELRFSTPGDARYFTLVDDLVLHEVVSDNVFVFVRRDLQSGTLGEKPTLLGTMHYQQRSLVVDRTAGSWTTSLSAAFHLGVDHIREGTDHLMFLLMLLLVAPVTAMTGAWQRARDPKRALVATAKIATAFTIGHSLTLALGAVGGVALPTRLVESLIAISILISALHAWRPLFAGREPLVAAGFGLVHGLAFATALAGFGFDGRSLVLALFGFNLGVEAMQLVVIAMIAPALIALARYAQLRIALAAIGGICALAWLAQRALGIATPLPALVDRIAKHGIAIAVALALLALAAKAFTFAGTWNLERRNHHA